MSGKRKADTKKRTSSVEHEKNHKAQETSDDRDDRDSKPSITEKPPQGERLAGWIVTFVPVVMTLWWCWQHDEISRTESHTGRMWLAVIGIVLVVVSWQLADRGYGLGWPRNLFDPRRAATGMKAAVGRLVVGLWISAAAYGAFNYYQFEREVFTTPGDYGDVTYYYLNSKYFEELGYYNLYEAMLVADDEGPARFRRVHRYRDLITYHKTLPRRNAIARSEQVKKSFTPARWRDFSHDLNYITSKNPRRGWQYVFTDHGYNPPPSWTLVGGAIAWVTPVEYLSWCTMVDFVLVIIMFACVAWAFGGPTALVALLWFLATFSGRWPILGQSLLRFDWLTAVVVAVCVMKKGFHGLSGGLLTYAALNRVFPAVFGFPYVVWMVREIWKARKAGKKRWIRPEHKSFLYGLAASLILFGGGALVTYGTEAHLNSAHNLRMHGGPDSFSSHRVGLGDALIYQGEWSRADLHRNGSLPGKTERLQAIHSYLKILGIICFVMVAVYVWRTRRPPWQVTWLGILPVFVLTTPQINYFNMRLLLIILHMELFKRPGHRWALLLLILIEAVTQYIYGLGASRYTVTTTSSLGLCLYFVLMIGLLIHEQLTKTDGDDGDDEELVPAES